MTSSLLKRGFLPVFVGLYLLVSGPVASAGELVAFMQDGCPSCDKWKKVVGDIYPLTDEARLLPLRQIDIHERTPVDLSVLGNVRFTPTFVVMDKGQEIGRIIGFHSEDAFYGLLGEIIEKLDNGKSASRDDEPVRRSGES